MDGLLLYFLMRIEFNFCILSYIERILKDIVVLFNCYF